MLLKGTGCSHLMIRRLRLHVATLDQTVGQAQAVESKGHMNGVSLPMTSRLRSQHRVRLHRSLRTRRHRDHLCHRLRRRHLRVRLRHAPAVPRRAARGESSLVRSILWNLPRRRKISAQVAGRKGSIRKPFTRFGPTANGATFASRRHTERTGGT